MGVCYRYIQNQDEAADVFQEAFIKIFQRLEQVKDAKALAGWIKKTAVNTALDHLKTTRFHSEISDLNHELSDGFYSELLDKMSNEVIIETIGKLPQGYRIIFNLSVIDGYSHKEIAEQLKISESTSRSQLTHAKRLLKKYLNELGITKYEQVI